MPTTNRAIVAPDSYAAEWRQGVNDSLQESARLHREASVAFERLKVGFDEHDRRIKDLEDARKSDTRETITSARATPEQMRANVALAISAASVLLLLIATIIAPHWK